jgi:hypothetical protein
MYGSSGASSLYIRWTRPRGVMGYRGGAERARGRARQRPENYRFHSPAPSARGQGPSAFSTSSRTSSQRRPSPRISAATAVHKGLRCSSGFSR